MMIFRTCLLTCLLAVFSLLPLSASAQTLIREIRVQGAERIEPQTVVSYMNLNVGDPMTKETFNTGLKSLFSTGLFADVTLRQQADAVVVEVVENPVINRIVFEGNSQVEDNELLGEVQMRSRQVYTRTKVQNDVSRLYQVYRRAGRFAVNIEPKIIKQEQNRVDVVFEIQEGEVTNVEAIRFVGNRKFSDAQLRGEISTKEGAWYRFLTSDDRYDPDRLAFDQELLRRFYLSQGYVDFDIVSANAELSNDQSKFFITFTVEEGERYQFGDVRVDAPLRDFDPSVLQQKVDIESGEWYDANQVQRNADMITDELGDLQYAFVDVRADTNKDRENKTVDLVYQVSESPRVFVEQINVNGNVRTMDKVVRRELLVVESDPYNKSKIARSEQNIRNLDFFETVDLSVSPGSAPDKTVVDIDVTEKSTGELSIGAGFSTNDGPLADLSIRERNFLGKGQELLFATTIAGLRTDFNARFTEPRFLGRDLSAGVDAFHTTRDFQNERSFDQQRTGGALRMGYPLSQNWRQNFAYRFENNEITDIDSNASRFIRDQEGERATSAVSQRLTYDTRNSRIFPTEGSMLWLDTELSGLGGDSRYVSGTVGGTRFFPITENVIFNALGEVGAIEGYGDQNVVINERFFLGGPNSMRGFERSGIGPRDSDTNDSLGGNFFYRGSAEVTTPIWGVPDELGIKLHSFTDFGSLYGIDETGSGLLDDSSVRVSAGVGFSWRSPFGPIRVDFAAPIAQEDYDVDEVIQFNFGTRF